MGRDGCAEVLPAPLLQSSSPGYPMDSQGMLLIIQLGHVPNAKLIQRLWLLHWSVLKPGER